MDMAGRGKKQNGPDERSPGSEKTNSSLTRPVEPTVAPSPTQEVLPPIRAQKIVIVPIAKIKPYAANAREHPPEQLAALQKSLGEYGFAMPLMVDRDFVLIKGHGTLQAALELGVQKAPVVVADWLTPEQVRAFRIADNALADLSAWNNDTLRVELLALSEANFDVLGLSGLDLKSLGDLGLLGDGALAEDTSPGVAAVGRVSLAEQFGIAPFSVLNARAGWWQNRKRAWLALGIQSEVGRGENVLAMSPMMLGVTDDEGRARIHATQREHREKKKRADAARKQAEAQA